MIPYIFALLYFAAFAAASSSTSQWSDFTNNFATDIAPIIALFGEQVTKQFLSESVGFLDNIIFGVAPLGILTAVVSVIRVYGNSSLKSFIGRAQEAHGVAEAELCSSTSEDVCELWSNGGICRVFGRPRILEFFYTEGGEFYPKFRGDNSGDEASQSPSCGIDIPKRLFAAKKGRNDDDMANGSENSSCWKEIDPMDAQDAEHGRERVVSGEEPTTSWRNSMDDPERWKSQERFAPYPNLSLNVGIRTVPDWILGITAVFGISLQLSFFVYATWATFYHSAFYDPGKSPQLWSYCLAVTGTVLLVFGMILCAMLIERKSCERRFTKKVSNDPSSPKTVILWLQPGGQRVGDQLFNAFAHSQEKHNYVTSWRVDAEPYENNPDLIKYPLIILWVAIISSLLGFLCQFVGLRGLHGSIALYQLASTLCMAVVRALLRSRRLQWEKNELKNLHRDVEGHELDWQALNIGIPRDEVHNSREPYWYINDYASPHNNHGDEQLKKNGNNVEVLELGDQTGQQIVGFRSASGRNGDSKLLAGMRCSNSAVDWIRTKEMNKTQPNEAARIMHFRSRLAYLTGDPITPPGQGWDTEIRKMAVRLQGALQDSAEYIFSGNMELSGDWKDASAIVWSTTCQVSKLSVDSPGLPIYFSMNSNNGRWKISKYQLEAALGLWWWSLKRLDERRDLFTEKIILVEESKKIDFMSAIRLWVTQTYTIDERMVLMVDPVSPNSPGSTLSVPTKALLGKNPPKPGSGVLLAIETKSTPLEMIAQDIFTIFISRIAEILVPLKQAALRQRQIAIINPLGDSQDQPYLGLLNAHVEYIADKMVSAGIGSQQDVLMSIIPPLLKRSRLPQLEEVFEDLLSSAKTLKRESKFPVGEDILKGLLHLGPPQFQERVTRTLGELYRAAIQSQKESERGFGWHGAKNMRETCTVRELSDEAKKTLDDYESVWKYFQENGISNQTGQNPRGLDSLPENFLKELLSQRARPRGLTLTHEIDLTKEGSGEVMQILRWAIEENCPELLEDIWTVRRTLIDQTDRKGRTPIFWAIEFGCDTDTFQSLLEWPNARADSHDTEGKTPIMLAAEKGHYKAIELLLKRGVDIMGRDRNGRAALSLASENGQHNVIELLLNQGADINAQDSKGKTPLLIAAENGNHKVIELLLNQGADTEIKDEEGRTALSQASSNNHHKAVKLLVEVQAEVNAQDDKYGSALAAAVHWGNIEIVKFLVQEGKADVNLQLQYGAYGSALAAAVHWGNIEIVKFLVQEGKADVNLQLKYGDYGSALTAAVHWENAETIEFLIREGKADVDLLLKNGKCGSALAIAAYLGRRKGVELLIEAGAQVNLKLENGCFGTALQAALADISQDDLQVFSRGRKTNRRREKDEVVALLKSHGATE